MPPASTLDVYRDWLGIQETARPLDHYQLLRLKQFEDDASKFPQRYRKMTGHVRKVAEADHPELADKLIRELIDAMLCLADARRKRDYDRRLGRPEDGRPRHRTFERALLDFEAVDALELNKAKNFALAVGFELRDALIQRRLGSQEIIMMAYAESVGLPYLLPIDIRVDESLLEKVPDFLARRNSCVPLRLANDLLLMLSPFPISPQVAEQLHERSGLIAHTVLCGPQVIARLLAKHYPRAMPTRESLAAAGVSAASAEGGGPDRPSAGAEMRRSAAVTALADMKVASIEGPRPEESKKSAMLDTVRNSFQSSREAHWTVTFATFAVTIALYQIGYGVYAMNQYTPYSMTMFWLGWFVALVAAGIGWFVSGILMSRI